jgi:DNA polymerase-4/DNA polymerase V
MPYTPEVEEYSIDECFCDLTGLRRPLRMSYERIAARIKQDLDTELGFTFSVGLAPTKVVAKIASKWQKPSGLTVIPGRELHCSLAHVPVEKSGASADRPRRCWPSMASAQPGN